MNLFSATILLYLKCAQILKLITALKVLSNGVCLVPVFQKINKQVIVKNQRMFSDELNITLQILGQHQIHHQT